VNADNCPSLEISLSFVPFIRMTSLGVNWHIFTSVKVLELFTKIVFAAGFRSNKRCESKVQMIVLPCVRMYLKPQRRSESVGSANTSKCSSNEFHFSATGHTKLPDAPLGNQCKMLVFER
jgi:hypothetical protein